MQDIPDTEERARALLAIEIEQKRREGLSFSEIAAALSTPGRPLTRNAVLGIAKRLEKQRADDARDMRICDDLAAATHSIRHIAQTYSEDHIRDMKREAGL